MNLKIATLIDDAVRPIHSESLRNNTRDLIEACLAIVPDEEQEDFITNFSENAIKKGLSKYLS